MNALIKWFHELGLNDVASVGGKNASLGEMVRELAKNGVRVPDGFAITAEAYWFFVRSAGLDRRIPELLSGLDTRDIENLRARGRRVREAVIAAILPPDLERDIVANYRKLCGPAGESVEVAVRSSATAEDLPNASFAGQQETYLNIRGPAPLLEACKKCFASLFTDRAISYRQDMGFDHFRVGLSIGIQRMVRSDLGTAGVMFSIDTESGFRDAVLINASYGLGETIVQGAVTPDEYTVFKPTLRRGFKPILNKTIGTKEFQLVYDVGGEKSVKTVPVPEAMRQRFAMGDEDILRLARWACVIEDHYGKPMDMEWAKDGRSGELFIVQARPETVQSRRAPDVLETYVLRRPGPSPVPLLATGRSVGEKIASGKVRVIRSIQELQQLNPGEILVTDKTDPDWEPMMKIAGGIVTNRGGRTCHAAIVSRELGLAAVVGTGNGTEVIRSGTDVTVSCAEGENGNIYAGILPFDVTRVNLQELRNPETRPRTRVMMNVGNPEEAFRFAAIPNDGVGLAREEFIISNHIKIHPLALRDYASLKDPRTRAEIDRLTAGWEDKGLFFVDRLAQGVALIAAAFYPKDVIVRLSDFKTNEYANLVGGREYEPAEENPMLGFRGAFRYAHPRYRDGFAMECLAMRKVRDEMGLTNVKLMVPFCRTVAEGETVLAELARHGLRRGENGLEVYVMCEIPSNVILAEEFARIFDGFSIGSNDLTQLILGVDRDSEIVASEFDERNPAVKSMIASVIRTVKTARPGRPARKIGICGQAPSDYPDFARFLVEEGIDSISLNPDAVLKTTLTILEAERGRVAA